MFHQIKKNTLRKIKIFIFVFIFVAATFYPTQKSAQAVDCWFIPCDEIFAKAMDVVYEALLAILKEEGAQMIADSVGDAAKFVTDVDTFLKEDPLKESNKFMNDYLTTTVAKGKSSASNYITLAQVNDMKNSTGLADSGFEGVGPNSFKIGLYQNRAQNAGRDFIETASAASSSSSATSSASNYLNKLVEKAKKETVNKVEPAVTYVGDPTKMFDDGNFKNLQTYASGINNPWSFVSNAESVFKEKTKELEKRAETEFVAGQGFLPTKDSDGKIKTPAITSKDIVSKSKTVGNDVLANAQDIPTAMITMILSMAAETITEGVSGGEKETSDNTAKKEGLQAEMDNLMKNSQDFDFMGSMEIQDFLLPSLFRKIGEMGED